MSEKEQLHGPDVSRETSESEIGAQPSPGVVGGEGARERAEPSPQAEAEPGGLRPDEITPEQQMLLDIMGRSMDQDSASGQGEEKEAEDSAPHQAEEREEKKPDAPPPLEKNKPSSSYVYLAVLFGAAFLMLLLAYFVQQRNNEATIDGLQDNWNLSRGELVAQIQELEEKRDWLQNAYDLQRERNDRVDEQNSSLMDETEILHKQLLQMTSWYDNAHTLDCLERFVRDKDYLMAGALVVDSDVYFNRNTSIYISVDTWQYLTPANEKRYLELKEELFRKSGFMILTQEGDGSGYTPGIPIIASDAFEQEELDSARYLWIIIRDYAIAPNWSAQLLAAHYDGLTQNSRLFRPSTMELLEEIKEDLIAQRLIKETDGALTATIPEDGPGDEILESDPE